ncbi:hypothetical protein PHJA_001012900 [Phtheirospermum japonicum]|uniref:Uncharacterized protein n=1 Tax=Phtheirospermum japonicum TaxID=374723 RepID=A0A830BRN5_9LAMI|nr:hypothetical protein PHJA_001012900 [Phtheirospermum japonicum]
MDANGGGRNEGLGDKEREALRSLLKMLGEVEEFYDSGNELEKAISCYNAINPAPIWAVAENYRFEPAFVEGRKLMAEIGDVINIHVIIEGSMNSSNPYYSSSWRRDFSLAGCEITSASTMTSHVDSTLPPPDHISSTMGKNVKTGQEICVSVDRLRASRSTAMPKNRKTHCRAVDFHEVQSTDSKSSRSTEIQSIDCPVSRSTDRQLRLIFSFLVICAVFPCLLVLIRVERDVLSLHGTASVILRP